jgi:antitoxin PrlF
MIMSKLTSKAQTTIPQAVRTALRIRPGDSITYAIAGVRVVLTKATHEAVEDPFAMFTEWDSETDRRAYASLATD